MQTIYLLLTLIVAGAWATTEKRQGKGVSGSALENIEGETYFDENKLPGVPNGKGQRCIQKIVQVQETEYDRGMSCQHTFKKKCHVTYVTDYVSAPERKCETTFKKNCHITFKPMPFSAQVKKCYIPQNHKCEGEPEGEEVCRNVYESHCETKYKNYDLEQDEPLCEKKEELRCKNETVKLLHLPEDNEEGGIEPFAIKEVCEKWPIQSCTVEKKKVTKTQTQIQNIPQEDCDLEPEENCRVESALVPKLIPKNNCVKIPKEVCVPVKTNPRQISKPVIKEWCYNPEDYGKKGGDDLRRFMD
ncbi:unnamed protein product [Lepeophtheirus salmonis]|uniref:(salmon louse) hypothetical protein n=1 Tax=Lepeophtheirus salmonis TaxID=72036 RepID=A0A7R8CZX0_LEPSM|nr:unnamed protein product [Lepeophtheirus salmonis]CAF2979404.1 unnamed protein product [Lepeophtheirus salmonis]